MCNLLIENICKKFELVYHYELPDKLPLLFESSYDIYEKAKSNFEKDDRKCKPSASSMHCGSQKFQRYQFIRKTDGSFEYLPLNLNFENLYLAVLKLCQYFLLNDIFSAFNWQEFEEFIRLTLDINGYISIRNFRFSISKKRFEIDIIARKNKTILLIDAKRWASKGLSPSALLKAAKKQNNRISELISDFEVLSSLLHQLKFRYSRESIGELKFYPMILVSNSLSCIHYDEGIPILSFHNFNDFLIDFHKISSKLLNYTFLKDRDSWIIFKSSKIV